MGLGILILPLQVKELKKALKLKEKEASSLSTTVSTANRRVEAVKADNAKEVAALKERIAELEEVINCTYHSVLNAR